jgi:hypothetical protein
MEWTKRSNTPQVSEEHWRQRPIMLEASPSRKHILLFLTRSLLDSQRVKKAGAGAVTWIYDSHHV